MIDVGVPQNHPPVEARAAAAMAGGGTHSIYSSVYLEALAKVIRLQSEARARSDPNADLAALATATIEAAPSVRTVRIVRIVETGLAFFADSETGKGQQLQSNPRAAICFHWHLIRYQVIFEGRVRWLSDADSDSLWRNVPRDYSLARWASKQNAESIDSALLQSSSRAFRQRFSSARTPRPSQWRAFEIEPARIDIWQTGWQRLRPHVHYMTRPDGVWVKSKRNP